MIRVEITATIGETAEGKMLTANIFKAAGTSSRFTAILDTLRDEMDNPDLFRAIESASDAWDTEMGKRSKARIAEREAEEAAVESILAAHRNQ